MSGTVVLLSGGLDSTVNFKAALDNAGVAVALTFDYGQRSANRETAAASAICERYGVSHERIDLPWLARGGNHAAPGGVPTTNLTDAGNGCKTVGSSGTTGRGSRHTRIRLPVMAEG